jgi:hypothetical protein
MATITILQWREQSVGFTGWDAHANSEMKRRLKQAIQVSPATLRQYVRQIQARQLVTLEQVAEEYVSSVRQILETQGAEVSVAPGRVL